VPGTSDWGGGLDVGAEVGPAAGDGDGAGVGVGWVAPSGDLTVIQIESLARRVSPSFGEWAYASIR
jgi:hypothetical protein